MCRPGPAQRRDGEGLGEGRRVCVVRFGDGFAEGFFVGEAFAVARFVGLALGLGVAVTLGFVLGVVGTARGAAGVTITRADVGVTDGRREAGVRVAVARCAARGLAEVEATEGTAVGTTTV